MATTVVSVHSADASASSGANALRRSSGSVKPIPHFPEFVFITGPMFSGKTSEIQKRVYRQSAICKTLVINNINDMIRQNVEAQKRGETPRTIARGDMAFTVSHAGNEFNAMMAQVLMEDVVMTEEFAQAGLIAVDEAQFFDRADLHKFILHTRYNCKKGLIIAGLHADSDGNAFLDHNFMMTHCTKVKLLSTKCQHPGCFNDAHQTHANFNKKGRVAVGTEGYVPLCDYHYLETRTESVL